MLPLTGFPAWHCEAMGRRTDPNFRSRCRAPLARPLSAPGSGGSSPMSRIQRLPLLFLLVAPTVPPARAEIAGHPWEATLGGGWQEFDIRDHIKNRVLGQASVGYRCSTGLTIEGSYLSSWTRRYDPIPAAHHTWVWTGVDMRFN